MRRSLALAFAVICALVATSVPASAQARPSAVPTRHNGRDYVALMVVSALYVRPATSCPGRLRHVTSYASDITGVSVSGGGATTTNTYDTGGTGELATQKVVTGSATNFSWTFGYNAEGDETSTSPSRI